MIKKIATAGASAALVLALATPAFAATNVTNFGFVGNNVVTRSNTGANNIAGVLVLGGGIQTGSASSTSLVANQVNTVDANSSFFNSTNVTNVGVVGNNVQTTSNSGRNNVTGFVVAGGSVATGGANSGAGVVNVVNTTTTH
jgi:hypothetical protein